MKAVRTLRGKFTTAFAVSVLGTVLVFGAATAGAILLHDHGERRTFEKVGSNAFGWDAEDAEEAWRFGGAMVIASPIAVAGAVLFGLWLSRRALAPLQEAARRARSALLGQGELELPVRGTGDEWDQLAKVTNDLLRAQSNTAAQARAFSANAAHELRTPLTAMLGEVQVTLRRDRDPEQYRAALRVVEGEAQRLSRLVEMLLVLARADSGTLQPSSSPFDLARAARLAADRARRAHPEVDARLSLRLVPTSVMGDPLLTGRVLDNLIDNALRHGGRSVQLTVTASGPVSRIEVSDDGPGVPVGFRSRVFERFARDGSTSAGGFGLGLPIARAMVESQGGRIWLAEGTAGARFVVELPAASSSSAPD